MFRDVDLIRLVYFICSTLVSVHGLKNEIYSCVVRLFRLMAKRMTNITCVALVWIKKRLMFHVIYSCVARLFRFMD